MSIVVLGATGHIGGACARALLAAGEDLIAVTRDEGRAADWRARGAEAAVVDVTDVAALRAVFRRGRRAFLLNPPGDIAGDTDAEEHRTAAAIVAALDGSGLEQVVVQSAYGAQAGDRIGDLSVLYDFEQAVQAQPIPATIQRGAYFMSNLDALLDPARGGTLPTMIPADLTLPMVAPADLGAAAARRLRAPVADAGVLHFVEGPARYTMADAAAAFAAALGRAVTPAEIPRDRWVASFRALGFSAAAADAFARMTAVSVDGFDQPAAPERGPTPLARYVADLVARSG